LSPARGFSRGGGRENAFVCEAYLMKLWTGMVNSVFLDRSGVWGFLGVAGSSGMADGGNVHRWGRWKISAAWPERKKIPAV